MWEKEMGYRARAGVSQKDLPLSRPIGPRFNGNVISGLVIQRSPARRPTVYRRDQRPARDSLVLDVLVVPPHPDDAHLGPAGAILKLKADGLKVGVLDLTDGEPTPFGTPELRARET